MKPKRIQRKRIRGWRMPENTVYVGRPTKWGNPFKIGVLHNTSLYLLGADRDKERMVRDCALIQKGEFIIDGDLSVKMYKNMMLESFLKRALNPMWREELVKLRGRNLACWCSLDKPCHADVLLEIANASHNHS